MGSFTAGTDVKVTAGQSIIGKADDGVADITAGSNNITLTAGKDIAGTNAGERLELAAGSQVVANSTAGSISLEGLGALTLTQVKTNNGAIDVLSSGLLSAVSVDSSATDSDSNDIRLESTAGDVSLVSVSSGPNLGDVTVVAKNNIIDGDTPIDDLDVSGNDVTLTATTGSIGGTTNNIFTGTVSPLEVKATGDLTANATAGLIALDVTVGGKLSLNTTTAWIQSKGDLDVSTSTFTVNNLALIADVDNNGTGTLTLGNSLTVPGDLRLEGADVVAKDGTIDLAAKRLMFNSDKSETISVTVEQLDASTLGSLNVQSLGADLELIDLNEDNVAVETRDNGSIDVASQGNLLVTDDVIAGNDGLVTSTGDLTLRADGKIVVNDTVLSDKGNVAIKADSDLIFGSTKSANDSGNDDLLVISSIDGNITLIADADGDANGAGGSFTMAPTALVIAGRDPANYTPGTNGLPSSNITLGNVAQAAGAGISIQADQDVKLAFVQTTASHGQAIQVQSGNGAIVDGSDVGGQPNLTATFTGALVSLTANKGIGSGDAIETNVYAIDARNLASKLPASGNIELNELAVGGNLNVVHIENQAANGDISVKVDAGDLNVVAKSFTPNAALFGVQAVNGQISLQSVANDLSLNSDVSSVGGKIVLNAGDDVLVNANVLTAAQEIVVTSGNAAVDGAGADGIIMSDKTRMESVAGTIRLTALNDSDIVLGNLDTVNLDFSVGTVVLSAERSILAGANDLADLNVQAGTLRMTADSNANGSGSIGLADSLSLTPDLNPNAINTQVQLLTASSRQGIYIEETDAVSIDVQSLGNGPVKVVSGSQLTVVDDNGDTIGVSAAGNGDVLLQTTDGDIFVNAKVQTSGGHLTLIGTDDVVVNAEIAVAGNGDLYIQAKNALVEGATDGASIQSAIKTDQGDLYINSAANINIAASTTSTAGTIGLAADLDVTQSSAVEATGASVFIRSGQQVTMTTNATVTAANTIIVDSKSTQTIASLKAAQVALVSGKDVFDGNDAKVNVTANGLSISAAGSIGKSDPLNVFNTNDQAIDTAVDVLAASAKSGIYIQQLASRTGLVVDSVFGQKVELSVQQARFNSTVTEVTAKSTSNSLSDLTTTAGPIKIVVDSGSLTLRDGLDADGKVIDALGGDILLETRGANSDIISEAAASISTDIGNITLRSSDDISLGANLSTGNGFVYLKANNDTNDSASSVSIIGKVSSTVGDVLIDAAGPVDISGAVTADAGSVGIISSADVLQSGTVNANANVFVDAKQNLTMTGTSNITSGQNIFARTGNNQTLTLLQATNVAIDAGGNVIDGNKAAVNVNATNLQITSKGSIGANDLTSAPNVNLNAIDIDVDVVAAQSVKGIYLEQVASAGALKVGNVAAVSVTISGNTAEFNSKTSAFTDTRTIAQQNDLVTTDGPVKLVVDGGTLTITDGANGDGVGVKAGNTGSVLLTALGAGSDVITTASIASDKGPIQIDADDDISLGGKVSTGDVGTIFIDARNQTVGDAAVDGLYVVSGGVASANGDIVLRDRRKTFAWMRTSAQRQLTLGSSPSGTSHRRPMCCPKAAACRTKVMY